MAPGPTNRPDGKPEVVLIDNGDLTILDATTGKLTLDRSLGGGLPDALGPGAEISLNVSLTGLPVRGAIRIFAVVDPAKAIPECDEANNSDAADSDFLCEVSPG